MSGDNSSSAAAGPPSRARWWFRRAGDLARRCSCRHLTISKPQPPLGAARSSPAASITQWLVLGERRHGVRGGEIDPAPRWL